MNLTFSFAYPRVLLIAATILAGFSPLSAQDDLSQTNSTEKAATNKKPKGGQTTAQSAEKNANDLRKTALLLSIAQDRDRQAGEALEEIRSKRLRIEEDLTDADENPKSMSKKDRTDLDVQLKSLQKKEKLAQKSREIANNLLLQVTEAVAAEPANRAKFIKNYELKFGPINDSKPTETVSQNTLANAEKEHAKTVAVAEKSKSMEEGPSVMTPVFSEITPATPTVIVPEEKKKKEPKPKRNESPKKVAEKSAKKKNTKAEKPAEPAPKTEDFPTEITQATPPPIEKTVETPPVVVTETPSVDEPISEEKDVKSNKKSKKSNATEVAKGPLVNYRTYERNADVYMATPAPECAIAFEGKDEFTGKMKRETAPTRFFYHTDEIMRKSLMDKEFITCDISGTKIESSRYTYLNLTFTILSKDIQRSLGFLDRGTPIIFVLVDGTKVTMKASKTDIGVVDIDKGTTIYRALLINESVTDLTNSEIDYVRVNWSSGYEDYEVFDVDVLKNMFNCLYKNK
jgi:hypothetical protein